VVLFLFVRLMPGVGCGRVVTVCSLERTITMVRALWNDEAGFVISTELLLVATILVLGVIVGLVSVRNNVVTELADLAGAIGALDQTYGFSGITACNSGTAGSAFTDATDQCEIADGTNGGDDVAITVSPANGQ